MGRMPAICLMKGTNAIPVGAVGPFNPGPTWHIRAAGDFNDDRSAILWQHDNGTLAISNGMNLITGVAVAPFNPGHDWHIIA
jgi:hypothetical protein